MDSKAAPDSPHLYLFYYSMDVRHGEVDWSESSDRVHRAVHVGKEIFEEVVTFFLDRPQAVPQPENDCD
jgi:hypothetical protein